MQALQTRSVILAAAACLLALGPRNASAEPAVQSSPPGIAAVKESLAGYDFIWPDAIPSLPNKTTLIDETAPTPAGAENPCREALNFRLGYILGQMKTRVDAAGNTVPDIGAIPNAGAIVNGQSAIDSLLLEWAVWGYLSADSQFKGDARLPPVIATWLDRFKEGLQTPPADEKARAAWKPDVFNPGWGVFDTSAPLLEILARPAFVEAIGTERVEYLRRVFLDGAARRIEKEQWNKTMALARDIVNMPVHEFAVYYHAWLLTGEPRYYVAAYSLIRRMHDIQQANGTIPYLTTVKWPAGTRVGITMYYLSVYNDALYDFWQRGDDEMARATLAKNATAYLLRMEPGPHYEHHTIGSWWKNTWRTFTWPGGLAMAALAANNGELLAVARREFGKGPGLDNWKLTLGVDAFRKAGLAGIEEQPRQDRYIVADTDIGGLRGRFGGWAFNFNTTSYSHTLGGVMARGEKGFSFLHSAMPTIQVVDLQAEPTNNLVTIEKIPPTPTLLYDNAGHDAWAVAMASYHPYAAGPTWQVWEQTPAANAWKCEQLWFYLPGEAIAVLRSTAVAPTQAVAHEHRFRFGGGAFGEGAATGPDSTVGSLTMTVLDTSFLHRVVEKGRLCDLGNDGGATTEQLALTDVERPTIQEAVAAAAQPAELAKLGVPTAREYSDDAHRLGGGPRLGHYSLVRFHPAGATESKVRTKLEGPLITMTVETGSTAYIIHANPSDKELPAPASPEVSAVLWQGLRGETAIKPAGGAASGPLAPGEARVYVRRGAP